LESIRIDERERAIYRNGLIFIADRESDKETSERVGRIAERSVIAHNLSRMNMPMVQIVTATGLIRAQVEGLCDTE